MANREFLLLAKPYDPVKHDVSGWFVSQKCDGQRAFWDGGITRGMLKSNVPWANCNKDERYVKPPVSTGLWTRYGNVIHAPKWWLDKLPTNVCLDGELFCDRGMFQWTRSVVSTLTPDDHDWQKINFMIIDSPSPEAVFESGRINNPQWPDFHIDMAACMELYDGSGISNRQMQFEDWVHQPTLGMGGATLLEQDQLPWRRDHAHEELMERLSIELEQGGEGLIVRAPGSYWGPVRSKWLLKVKLEHDAEGTVVGYKWGEEGVDGKLLGLMGAVRVRLDNGKEFWLSGFREAERVLTYEDNEDAYLEGRMKAGMTVETRISNRKFPRDSKISFKFMGWTDDGLPREPRFWRK